MTTLTTHTLQIPVVNGTWSAPRGRLDQSLLELELELGAMTSAPQKIADIAKSPHFLNTAKFPRARFEGRWLRPRVNAKASGYELFFDLVLKNRRKHLLAPAVLTRVGCDVRMTTEFRVDRHEFGVAGSGRYEDLVGRGIEVRIEATAPTAPFGVPCAGS